MLISVLKCVALLYVVHLSLAHIQKKKKGKPSDLHASSIAKPSNTQARWLDFEVGASIHFNMQTFDKSMKSGTWIVYSLQFIH